MNIKHKETNTKLYGVWTNIKTRCLNPNSESYKDYGGRGITICNEWLEFAPFRDWALSNGYAEGLQINRIENDGNYEPSNCNFVTAKENQRNTRSKKVKSIKEANEIRKLYKTGEYTQKQLAIKYNITQQMIYLIINNKNWKT